MTSREDSHRTSAPGGGRRFAGRGLLALALVASTAVISILASEAVSAASGADDTVACAATSTAAATSAPSSSTTSLAEASTGDDASTASPGAGASGSTPAPAPDVPGWWSGSDNGSSWKQFRDWDGPIDVAIGGLADGHTWAQAATGGLDDHWTAILTNPRDAWSPRDPGNLFIRPFHEFNGDWFDWTVTRRPGGPPGATNDQHRRAPAAR